MLTIATEKKQHPMSLRSTFCNSFSHATPVVDKSSRLLKLKFTHKMTFEEQQQ